MQELKSYREQNPGKGYLDWKASKYAEGGEIPPERIEVTDPTTVTDEELKAYRKYIKGRYFSAKEKDVIIDYLLDCLVNNEVFEYSTLGPNIYKNEHSISNVSDT